MASVLAEPAANAAKAAFSSATLKSATPFAPRQTFEVSSSIVRSYFLGHHHAALSRMRRTLSNVGLVIECRDMRVPLTSWNPLLESSLMYGNSTNFGRGGDRGLVAGGSGKPSRPRIIVYTHRDLVPKDEANRIAQRLTSFHEQHGPGNTSLVFHGARNGLASTKELLEEIRRIAHDDDSITGLRALVVGMPNAGKSSLLNRLRSQGKPVQGRASKVAKTGSEPGVTRKLGTPVRIIAGDDDSEGVFVMDTPGVFIPLRQGRSHLVGHRRRLSPLSPQSFRPHWEGLRRVLRRADKRRPRVSEGCGQAYGKAHEGGRGVLGGRCGLGGQEVEEREAGTVRPRRSHLEQSRGSKEAEPGATVEYEPGEETREGGEKG